MVYTFLKGEKVGKDVWDARTLEWSLPNPPPEYNYRVIPTVHARDAYWYNKQHKEEIAQEEAEHAKAEAAHGGIHTKQRLLEIEGALPSPHKSKGRSSLR